MTTEPDRITAHTRDTSHVAQGLALLTQQFRGKPVIAAILSAWLTQVQILEDASWAMLVDTTLARATHAQLDQIGTLLGWGRGYLETDTVYRGVLRAVILAHRSSGTANELLAIVTLLAGDPSSVLTEYSPATITIERETPWPIVDAQRVASVVAQAKSGGVRLLVEDLPTGDLFAFASSELPETDALHGLSDTTGFAGGELVGMVV